MKKFVLFLALNLSSIRGQTAPELSFRRLASGAIEVTWPIEKIHPSAPDLVPSYRLEMAGVLNQWMAQPDFIRGSDFIEVARIQVDAALPAAFMRVQAILDFAGGSFILRDLAGAVLQHSRFMAADLRAANLRGVDFRSADLTLARLADAVCIGVDFLGANLRFVEFTGADLSFARLENADLRGAVIQQTTNSFTRYHGSMIDSLTVLEPEIRAVWQIVNNQGANRNFDNLNLSFSDLSAGNLTNATLRNADLSGVDFQMADLRDCNLTNANLRLVDFRGALINAGTSMAAKSRTIHDIINNPRAGRAHVNADLTLGFWVNVMLDQADLRGARFTSGIFSAASFVGANGAQANFSSVNFDGADFRNANLTGANFTFAILNDVDLRGATTNGANFQFTVFRNVTMPDGSVR